MRDQAAADAERVQATLGSAGRREITPAMIDALSTAAHGREGRLRQEHLSAAYRGRCRRSPHHGIEVRTAANLRRRYER